MSAALCVAVSTREDSGRRWRVGKVALILRELWGWGGMSLAELGLSPCFQLALFSSFYS